MLLAYKRFPKVPFTKHLMINILLFHSLLSYKNNKLFLSVSLSTKESNDHDGMLVNFLKSTI